MSRSVRALKQEAAELEDQRRQFEIDEASASRFYRIAALLFFTGVLLVLFTDWNWAGGLLALIAALAALTQEAKRRTAARNIKQLTRKIRELRNEIRRQI